MLRPVSEWLHIQLRPFFRTLVREDTEYDRLFDRFELLWTLEALAFQSRYKPLGRFAAIDPGPNNPFARIIKEQKDEGADWAPLRAGFFQGSEQVYKDALNDLIKGTSGYL